MGTHPIFESDFDCLTAFSEMSYYTIWMGDLPPDCRREHVIKSFEGYGTLGGIRLMNNFGFVDFKHKRDAKDAVKDLNGEKLRGARIRLEMSDGPGNRKSGTSYEETAAFSTMREERGFNPRFERPYRTKYGMAVSNLTKKFSWSDLKNFMRQAGEVTYTDAHIRSGKNRGEVCFKNRKGLYTAKKKLDRTKLHGRRIRLKIIEDGSRAVGSHKHHSSRTPEKNEVDQNQEVLQDLEADQEVHLVQEADQEVLQEVDLEVDPVLDLEVDHEHGVEHQRRREVEAKNDQEAQKKRNPRNVSNQDREVAPVGKTRRESENKKFECFLSRHMIFRSEK